MVSPTEILLRDPLSEVTRKERKFLLGACAISITIVKTGLVPTKISALGVDFTHADQKSLLIILAVIVVYFLAAFLVYAISDFIAWRVAFHGAVREKIKARVEEQIKPGAEQQAEMIQREMNNYTGRSIAWASISKPVSLIRVVLDFFVPLLIGVITIALLLLTDIAK